MCTAEHWMTFSKLVAELKEFDCLAPLTCHQRRAKQGYTVGKVGIHNALKRLFRGVGNVKAATTVSVKLDKRGQQISALGVYRFRVFGGRVLEIRFKNLSIANENGYTFFKPSVYGKAVRGICKREIGSVSKYAAGLKNTGWL